MPLLVNAAAVAQHMLLVGQQPSSAPARRLCKNEQHTQLAAKTGVSIHTHMPLHDVMCDEI